MFSKHIKTVVGAGLVLGLILGGWAVYSYWVESKFRQAVIEISKKELGESLEFELPQGLNNDTDLKDRVRSLVLGVSDVKVSGYAEIDKEKRIVQLEVQTLKSEYLGDLANILFDLRAQNKNLSYSEINEVLNKKLGSTQSLRSMQKKIVVTKKEGGWEEVP